ncbi:hypothetical protein ACFYXL_33855 [Streptomyces tsukubensis]
MSRTREAVNPGGHWAVLLAADHGQEHRPVLGGRRPGLGGTWVLWAGMCL